MIIYNYALYNINAYYSKYIIRDYVTYTVNVYNVPTQSMIISIHYSILCVVVSPSDWLIYMYVQLAQ